MIILNKFKNRFYGSVIGNSNIFPTNSYGWGFKFKKKSFQNLVIQYGGVFHIGARIRARILDSIVTSDKNQNKTLFEAGSGMGLNSIYLSKYFKKVLGVDNDLERLRQAKQLIKDNRIKNISFKNGDLLKNNFTKEKFDVVICFEVIEHVDDDKKLLKNLSSRLNRNGKIILSFPSKSLLSAIAQKSLDHKKIGYLPRDIKKILKDTGLVISEEYSLGNSLPAKAIIGFDFFLRKTFPILSAVLFPVFYPFIVIDLNLFKMGIPRGYVLVLKRKNSIKGS